MSKRPATKPAAPVDQRTQELARLDAEIERIRGLVITKLRTIAEDEKKHCLDQNEDLQRRLTHEVADLRQALEALRDRRFQVEIAEHFVPVQQKVAVTTPRVVDMDEPDPASESDYVRRWAARYFSFVKAMNVGEDTLALPVSLRYLAVEATGTVETMIDAFKKRDTEIEALKKRIEQLEAGGIAYRGVHQRAAAYERGSMVTADGSAWIAVRYADAGEAPGESTAWQLAVKKGRDGKDSR